MSNGKMCLKPKFLTTCLEKMQIRKLERDPGRKTLEVQPFLNSQETPACDSWL